jgi:hypothetical protein
MKQQIFERLRKQEQRHAPAVGWVVIYDPSTGQPLNGSIPATATTIIFLPDNGRGDYERNQPENQ